MTWKKKKGLLVSYMLYNFIILVVQMKKNKRGAKCYKTRRYGLSVMENITRSMEHNSSLMRELSSSSWKSQPIKILEKKNDA